jgi:ATP-dependent Zn protease
LLAGRVAEEHKFNEIFTGAENDIERATKIAMIWLQGLGCLQWVL